MSFIQSLGKHIPVISDKNLTNTPSYISTNEEGLDKVREILGNIPKHPNGVHLGVSGWHNYDIMALRKSKCGILVDLNKSQSAFNLFTLNEIFNKIEKTPQWMQVFQPGVSESRDAFTPYEQLESETLRPGSWLSDDESFEHIKAMAQEGRIFVVTADFQDTPFFEAVRETLEAQNLIIDTLYTSNIHDYIPPENADRFQHTVKVLSHEDTQHIYSSTQDKLLQTIKDTETPFKEHFGNALLKKGS
ncbi:MAG: hypothetical protein WB791_11555 [Waddliaceae bacterium]